MSMICRASVVFPREAAVHRQFPQRAATAKSIRVRHVKAVRMMPVAPTACVVSTIRRLRAKHRTISVARLLRVSMTESVVIARTARVVIAKEPKTAARKTTRVRTGSARRSRCAATVRSIRVRRAKTVRMTPVVPTACVARTMPARRARHRLSSAERCRHATTTMCAKAVRRVIATTATDSKTPAKTALSAIRRQKHVFPRHVATAS